MENQNYIKKQLIENLYNKLRSGKVPEETINTLMKNLDLENPLNKEKLQSKSVEQLVTALELVETHEMTSGSSAAADRSGAAGAAGAVAVAATGSGSGSGFSSFLNPTLGALGALGSSITRGLGRRGPSRFKSSASTHVKEGGNRLNNSKKNKKKFRNKGSEKRKKRSKKKQNKKSKRK